MLKRIIKMIGAQGFSVASNLFIQFLLPPLFLRNYGVAEYGEWLVLSATVSYLSSLNFGVTTYASNELTMLRQRGEMQEYRRLQGSTLALLLIMVALGVLVSGALGCCHFLHSSTCTTSVGSMPD